jgi:membrane-associated phospholipid phosphatase
LRPWLSRCAAGVLLAAFVVLAYASRLVPALSDWDRHVTEVFVGWRSSGWSRAFWIFTLVGDDPLMASLTAATVLSLVAWGKRVRAAAAAAGLILAWAAMHVAKAAVGRERPPEGLNLIRLPASHSMPSGHALISLVFAGLLVYLLVVWLDRRRPIAAGARGTVVTSVLKGLAVVAATAFAGFVGMSRVYLGVHWQSDVIAGWCLAGAVLLVALELAARWRRTGGPRGWFSEVEPWNGRLPRAVVAIVLALLVCAVAAVTAWVDPLS